MKKREKKITVRLCITLLAKTHMNIYRGEKQEMKINLFCIILSSVHLSHYIRICGLMTHLYENNNSFIACYILHC